MAKQLTEQVTKLIGVYAIENRVTGRDYVGSTAVSFATRWSQHRSMLKNNIHPCRELQHDWNAIGESGFEFRVVEVVDDPQCVLDRERYWQELDRLYCFPEDTYNQLGLDEPLARERERSYRQAAQSGISFNKTYRHHGGNRNLMLKVYRAALKHKNQF